MEMHGDASTKQVRDLTLQQQISVIHLQSKLFHRELIKGSLPAMPISSWKNNALLKVSEN